MIGEFGKGLNNNNGIHAKQQIYGSLLEQDD